MTLVLIAFAHGRTSSYDISVIGATSPGRWHITHLLKTIGATSLLKVGTAPAAGATVCTRVTATTATARVPRSTATARFMKPSFALQARRPALPEPSARRRIVDSSFRGCLGSRSCSAALQGCLSSRSLAHLATGQDGAIVVTDVMFRRLIGAALMCSPLTITA